MIRWLVEQLWSQCWQVTIVILGVGLVTGLFCKKRPHLAYILWLMVLLKCLTPPFWSSPTGIFSWLQKQPSASMNNSASSPPRKVDGVSSPVTQTDREITTAYRRNDPASTHAEVANQQPHSATASVPNTVVNTQSPSNDNSILDNSSLAGLIALWIVCAAAYSLYVFLAVWRCLRTIRKHEIAACKSNSLAHLAVQLSQRLGLRRSVRIKLVDVPLGPMTYGWFRPTVVLPQAFVVSRSKIEMEPVLAHELIHIRRGDAFVGLLQTISQSLFWFHPLVWWSNRRMIEERERCCDEEVITALNYPTTDYARGLLSIVELKQEWKKWKKWQKWTWPAVLPGIKSYDITKRRLEHLMQNALRFRKRTPPVYWVMLFVVSLLLMPGAGVTDSEAQNPVKEATAQPAEAIRVSQLLSPDGRQIAYGQVAVGPSGEQRVRIVVGNVDGTNRRALAIDAESVDEVQWYGNDRLAYVTKHGQDGYFLMDLEGKSAGRLSMPAGCDSFFHQGLSPDGKWIAYCGNFAEVPKEIDSATARERYLKEHAEIKVEHGLFVVNLKEQTVKHPLTETVANLPAWSDDSKHLAAGIGHYVRQYPLVIVDVETGKVERPDVQGVGVAWSPDGSHLAMTTDIVRGGSWRGGIPLDGTLGVWELANRQRKLVSPPGSNVSVKEPYSWVYSGSHGPQWSPDGNWIAYRRSEHNKRTGSANQSREEIWIVRADGSDARKMLNHGATEIAWTRDGKKLLYVAEGRFGSIDRDIDATALGPTPAAPEGAFSVQGRVTDRDGKPLEGVAIRVARGMGTLHSTEKVMTNADGWYEIHFGPGLLSSDANMQYACVFADKSGFFEKDLGRHGNLAMGNFKPKDFRQDEWGVAGVVYPGNPYRVDFTMLPAASVSLRLVNTSGEPLAKYEVHMSGEKLYPASSVLRSGKTDSEGRLHIDAVPMDSYHFSISSRRSEYKSEPISFDRAEAWRFRLVYDDLAGTLKAVPE